MRLFVALAPPPAALDELDAVVTPLRAGQAALRWTSRDAWHITLAYYRTPADARALVAALGGYRGPGWTTDRVHLIHSRPSGRPRYAMLGSWPLAHR